MGENPKNKPGLPVDADDDDDGYPSIGTEIDMRPKPSKP
jgi:hypothetical protein